MKYGKLSLGQIEAVVNKLGGMDGVLRLLSGELVVTEVTHPRREEDGVIRSSVTSDCRTGPEWVVYFEERGIHLSDWAKDLLLSDDFQPTSGVTTEIAILKGNLFSDDDCVTSKIRAKATELGFTKPNAEVACLIREKFSNEQIKAMGLWFIVCMHEPIQDSVGVPGLLNVLRGGGGSWLSADYVRPGDGWGRDGGFAFVVSRK